MIIEKLCIKNLSKTYRKKRIVDNVSLEVETGKTIGLLGPNGAGKTTTFYIIAGISTPDHGQIILNTLDINNYPIHKRASLGISYLPQESSIFLNMTIAENILAILELRTDLSNKQQKQRYREEN